MAAADLTSALDIHSAIAPRITTDLREHQHARWPQDFVANDTEHRLLVPMVRPDRNAGFKGVPASNGRCTVAGHVNLVTEAQTAPLIHTEPCTATTLP